MPQEKSYVSERNIGFFSATVGNVSSFNNIDLCKDINIEDFNNKIFNSLNIVAHVVDTDLNILVVSDEFVKFIGGSIKKEKMINSNLLNMYPYLKEANAELEYERVIKTGEMFISEEKIQHYGDTIYTSVSKIPIKDKNGIVETVLTVIKDISELKKLGEELKYLREESISNRSTLQELYN